MKVGREKGGSKNRKREGKWEEQEKRRGEGWKEQRAVMERGRDRW